MLLLFPLLLASASVPAEFPAMRAAICDKAEQFTADGCSVCPVYTRGPAGKGELSFDQFVEGSFTGSEKTEVLLSSQSCYDHASGFGSAILLRKENDKWSRVTFFLPRRHGTRRRLLQKDS